MPGSSAGNLAQEVDLCRKTRAEELRTLAEVLVSANLVSDASPIYSAASMAAGPMRQTAADAPDPGRPFWGYAIEDLALTLDGQWKGVPKNSAFDSSLLTITVHEYVPNDVADVHAGYGNLRLADVDFSMKGMCEYPQSEIAEIHCAWHLDTHLYEEPVATAHPKHHFQFGGNKIEAVAENIRGLWIPDTPRVMTFPLDGILAIDFVLSHYAGSGWTQLHEDARYVELRRAAAQRYWKPVAASLVEFFDLPKQQAATHPALKILPSLAWI